MTSSSAIEAIKRHKAAVIWGVRVVGSAVTLAVLAFLVPVEQVWRAAQDLPPWLWACALIAFLVGHAAAAAKWRLLIGPGVSYPQAFRAHLAGLAANLCLPGVAGGDVVRAGMVYRAARDPSQLAVGSLADRLLDTLGLAVIAAAGAVAAFGAAADQGRGFLIFVAVAGVALGLAAAGVIVLDRLRPAVAPERGPARLVYRLLTVAGEMVRRPGRLAACLAISMVVQLGFIGINVAFADATGLQAPLAAWVFAWAAAKIIAIAPISLGGLGAREASMAALMLPFGADPAQVIAVGLLWQTVLYASGALGALAQIFWKVEPAERVESPAAPAMMGRPQ